MALTWLTIRNLRVYREASLAPDPRLNVIVGPNAGGKTTLLEAIHLLGTGRSFRGADVDGLRADPTRSLLIQGECRTATEQTARLGLERDAGQRRMSLNGQRVEEAARLAQTMPLQAIAPDTHYLFQQNARHRRGVMDWGLFHVEPSFYPLWLRHRRLLAQRNAALRQKLSRAARHAWDRDLVGAAEALDGLRRGYVDEWNSRYRTYCHRLLGPSASAEVQLQPGWPSDRSLTEILEDDIGRDLTRGYTHRGAHRTDLHLCFNERPARQIASHGQQKLLVIGLRLAQIAMFAERTGRECTVLIDDLPAELDEEHRRRLLTLLAALPVQVFVTGTDRTAADVDTWPSHRVFHVEQGLVQPA